MKIKNYVLLVGLFFSMLACTNEAPVFVADNLQEYLKGSSNYKLGSVIACAANAKTITTTNTIFYYPEKGATDIRYYETESTTVLENDFKNYTRKLLNNEPFFGGKLAGFVNENSQEKWCLVSYVLKDTVRISNPIRLKNITTPTEYSTDVLVEFKSALMPKFTWEDGLVKENEIYFQVLSDVENNFISGTYTKDTFFKFYDTSNVVLTINTTTPNPLVLNTSYNFTLMAVSKDNWVNLIIEKNFKTE